MTAFEYLAGFLSLVFGLATTHLLGGIARTLHRRNIERLDEVHLVWSLVVFLVLVINWWTFFAWEATLRWSFEVYMVLVLWTVCQYMMVVTLYSPDEDPGDRINRMWEENRVWFLSTFEVMLGLDILQTSLRGALLRPIWYLPFVLHLALLGLLGIWIERRSLQRGLAWYVLITLALWAFVVRRFLAAS